MEKPTPSLENKLLYLFLENGSSLIVQTKFSLQTFTVHSNELNSLNVDCRKNTNYWGVLLSRFAMYMIPCQNFDKILYWLAL